MDFEDKTIVCADCGKEFAHTAEDQKRYAERGFTQDPKRCRECREARKEKAASSGGPRSRPPRQGGGGFGGPRREGRGGGGYREGGFREGGFREGGGGGGGGFRGEGRGRPSHRSGGGGGGGGGFGRGPRQSFEAVCAACGITTTVPFQPTQGREVFCRDCYKKVKGE